jgi:CRP-like cAMP-binding protein
MSEHAILDAFASHSFLDALGEQHRMRLASEVKPFRFAAGDYLAREGQPTDALYLIQSGHVEIGSHLTEPGYSPIQTMGPGDVVGWSWVLPPYQWQFDARASDAVQGLAFEATWLRDQCDQDHELGYHLLRQLLAVVSGRLTATRKHQQGGSGGGGP